MARPSSGVPGRWLVRMADRRSYRCSDRPDQSLDASSRGARAAEVSLLGGLRGRLRKDDVAGGSADREAVVRQASGDPVGAQQDRRERPVDLLLARRAFRVRLGVALSDRGLLAIPGEREGEPWSVRDRVDARVHEELDDGSLPSLGDLEARNGNDRPRAPESRPARGGGGLAAAGDEHHESRWPSAAFLIPCRDARFRPAAPSLSSRSARPAASRDARRQPDPGLRRRDRSRRARVAGRESRREPGLARVAWRMIRLSGPGLEVLVGGPSRQEHGRAVERRSWSVAGWNGRSALVSVLPNNLISRWTHRPATPPSPRVSTSQGAGGGPLGQPRSAINTLDTNDTPMHPQPWTMLRGER